MNLVHGECEDLDQETCLQYPMFCEWNEEEEICEDILDENWFELDHDGVTRTYLVSYPDNPTDPCPLIINMHGYTSNGGAQQIYSQMDDYAHPQNIAVVYPQGMDNYQGIPSWNVGAYWDGNSYDDVGFIDVLIDSVAANFNIDLDRVYACGMSNGGYMTYELVCELSNKITAFGSVTGNFMLNTDQDCDQDREIPIIHIHGTADPIVNYYPPSFDGSLTVGESIDYWSEYNNLTTETVDSISANVEKYTYYSESSTKFVHFKVYGGGHDWFYGSNWDFHSSEELINFFLEYKLSDFQSTDIVGDKNASVPDNIFLHQNFPNPFNPVTSIGYDLPENSFVNVTVFDVLGRKVSSLVNKEQEAGVKTIVWDGIDDNGKPVTSGVYFYSIRTDNAFQTRKMILLK
tara:strand:+ start:340 stop:1548 length:1209 start_codon:yes stop_codon:yes gene_type:complete